MIPADHISIDGDTAWLVVEADSLPIIDYRADTEDDIDRPCDTCGGDKFWLDWDREEPVACGDCHGTGRHVFDIKVEADSPNRCSRCGRLRLAWNSECHCGWSLEGPPACGFRSLRVHVVPGMVLPIVRDEDWDGEPWPIITRAVSVDDQWYVRDRYPDGTRYAYRVWLPPAAAPGMWAVQLRIVTPENVECPTA